MITIKDVAAAAGVSATTVSNVIHGYTGRVSKETADRILTTIEELGYVPNMSARSLVSHSSHMIALINHCTCRKNTDCSLDPFQLMAIARFEARLREAGYYMMFRSCRTRQELIAFLRNWNVDGLFVSGPLEKDFLEALNDSGKPVVLVDSDPMDSGLTYVGQDNYRGGFLSARYLLEQGHRRIGYASSLKEISSVAEVRFKGFRDALAEAGCPFDESLLFECDSEDIEASTQAADRVRNAIPFGMTALSVSSDHLALIIISRLTRNGIKIPKDISIIGFGDLPQNIVVLPGLTTLHYDVENKISLCVDYMLDLLCGKRSENIQTILPVSLIERESVMFLPEDS